MEIKLKSNPRVSGNKPFVIIVAVMAIGREIVEEATGAIVVIVVEKRVTSRLVVPIHHFVLVLVLVLAAPVAAEAVRHLPVAVTAVVAGAAVVKRDVTRVSTSVNARVEAGAVATVVKVVVGVVVGVVVVLAVKAAVRAVVDLIRKNPTKNLRLQMLKNGNRQRKFRMA